MAIKVRNIDKKTNKKYFHEDYRGKDTLKYLAKASPKNYRAFVKLEKGHRAYRVGLKIGETMAKGLETMIFRFAA